MRKTLLPFCLLLIPSMIFSQNVGIGTTSPSTRLHVSGTADNIAIFSGGSQMYITLAEGVNNRGYIGSYAGNPEDVDFGTYSGNPGKVHLTTGNIPRLTVLSNGNVGIGTVIPEQLFSVQSGMVVDQGNSNIGTVANTIRFGSSSGEAIGSKRTGLNNFGLDFYTQSLQRMTIANNGNIGINVAAPNAKLEIRGTLGFSSSTKRWEMSYDSTAGYFYIDEFGSARRFFIKNGGNVGINTSNPLATLDVNGDINIENKILLNNSAGNPGQVLVSNGSGNAAEWRNNSYSNNDRFLYNSFSQTAIGSNFDDTIFYSPVYTHSAAISYNNGVFTVNKTGLYHMEMTFYGVLVQTNTNGAYMTVQLRSNSTLELGTKVLSYLQEPSSTTYVETLTKDLTIYFTAGSTFYFYARVIGTQTPNIALIGSNNPLTINLIAE